MPGGSRSNSSCTTSARVTATQAPIVTMSSMQSPQWKRSDCARPSCTCWQSGSRARTKPRRLRRPHDLRAIPGELTLAFGDEALARLLDGLLQLSKEGVPLTAGRDWIQDLDNDRPRIAAERPARPEQSGIERDWQ